MLSTLEHVPSAGVAVWSSSPELHWQAHTAQVVQQGQGGSGSKPEELLCFSGGDV